MPDPKSNDAADESVKVVAVDDTTDDTNSTIDAIGTDETDSEAQPG